MTVRLAHAADAHLTVKASCGGKIVLDDQGRNIRWLDRVRCLEAFVDGAIERECELALFAGDLFDGPRPTPAEIVAAQRALYRLSGHMLTVVIPGNHDPALGDQPAAVETLGEGPSGLVVVTRPMVVPIPGASVACLPFPTRGLLTSKDEIAGMPAEDINALLSVKLRVIVRHLLAECGSGPKILLAHLPIVGARLNESQTAGQEHVSLTAEDLEGWDYVALGDLHLPQQVAARAFYPGSLDRTDFGLEHAEPGWNLVTMAAGSVAVEHIPTPARRYVTVLPDEIGTTSPADGFVYRVKGTVTQEEYDALQPHLARWRHCPTFTEDLDVARQTRARSEAVTDELSPEAALAEWAQAQGKEAELAALLEEHGRMSEAAR